MYIPAIKPSTFSCSPDGLCFAVRQLFTCNIFVSWSTDADPLVVPFVCDLCCVLKTTGYGCDVAAIQNDLLWLIHVRHDQRHQYRYVCSVKNVTDMAASAFSCVTLRIGKAYAATVINVQSGKVVFQTLWRPTFAILNSSQFLYNNCIRVTLLPPSSITVECGV